VLPDQRLGHPRPWLAEKKVALGAVGQHQVDASFVVAVVVELFAGERDLGSVGRPGWDAAERPVGSQASEARFTEFRCMEPT
jgi:hypothetical protein